MNAPKRIYICGRYAISNSLDIRVNDQEVEYIRDDLVRELVGSAKRGTLFLESLHRFLYNIGEKKAINGVMKVIEELKAALSAVEE